ncbi:uncharacterized protein RMCC_4097 [Mycolicibacterium canariasense]|uniref:Uncharacterized protein n=1 Tax=Mycolicibacterium canariasense TaxID=228230 RepID=A0A100WF59_MYCCR|nr:DUF6308 family protein [Mycolicibacterium canariasense]MCV7211532.1 hypothetical protein [Mycolicibacterium canariasense]ORV08533.1 hypothetical protein AWB94_12410 [Mycolicibacterium canariasense]GAS97131.1 uncharacterized protein RMCC_4097 [Mycolicibacterium canariasense]
MSDLQQRVLSFVAEPAMRLIEQFFDTEGSFAATTFDTLPDNDRIRFTTTDLLAVTLLDVALPPSSVRSLLESDASKFNGLLAAVPGDVDLWDASDEDLAHAEALYWALRKLPKVGRTRASKLMARKRPRLIPVVDSVIIEALHLGDDSWIALRACLSDPAVRDSIEASRPDNAPAESISTLRLLDAAVWMRCSQSRNAKAARRNAGIDS